MCDLLLSPMIRRASSVLASLLACTLLCSACSQPTSTAAQQYSPKRATGIPPAKELERNTYVNGPLFSGTGPFMTDRFGRTVTLHGVNAVYKLAPYTLTIQANQPNTLGPADAKRIAEQGFNVVRVGIIWEGIEPGTGGPNQPNICTPGTPKTSGMWNEAIAQRYLNQVQKVVNALGAQHIYALLDMHQDIYSSVFSGEGAPPWAVCTNGNPVVIYSGRWSNNYSNPAVQASFDNFFENSVVGGIQNDYRKAWVTVATRFKTNPWVVGYDPINEPLALDSAQGSGGRHYTVGLSCLYGGSGGDTKEIDSNKTISCPPTVPSTGLVRLLLNTDPNHLVFPEIDNATDNGKTLYVTVGHDYRRVVYNFHNYCPDRSGVTGNPTNLLQCANAELLQLLRQEQIRPEYSTTSQPQGPAIMMTEFGATNNPILADMLMMDAATVGLSWAWWAWRYYNDPTGSSDEALINSQNVYSQAIIPLARTSALAVAGSILASQYSATTGNFTLTYVAKKSINAPTTIFISPYQSTTGYCSYVRGARITSKPGAQYLTIDNTVDGATVVVRIEPGKCVAGL